MRRAALICIQAAKWEDEVDILFLPSCCPTPLSPRPAVKGERSSIARTNVPQAQSCRVVCVEYVR